MSVCCNSAPSRWAARVYGWLGLGVVGDESKASNAQAGSQACPPHVPRNCKHLSERELVQLLRRNDPVAAGEVVRRYGHLVEFLARSCAGEADTEDLAQEAWVKLARNNWRAVCSWEDRCPLSSFISVVVVRILKTASARIAAERGHTVELAEATVVEESSVGLSHEQKLVIRSCVSRLTGNQQLVVKLRFFDDLNHAEIARVLGISESSSRKRLFDAMRRLERMLSECCPELMG